jgi:hypothetical protein
MYDFLGDMNCSCLWVESHLYKVFKKDVYTFEAK